MSKYLPRESQLKLQAVAESLADSADTFLAACGDDTLQVDVQWIKKLEGLTHQIALAAGGLK